MQHLTFNVPTLEWLRIAAAAHQTWPDEKLSNAELLRRCVILGVRTLRYLSPEPARQFVAIYRNYQPPIDGDRRLITHAESEGDPSRRMKLRS